MSTTIAPETEVVRFPVRGMICGSCRITITKALDKVPGVQRVSVDLGHETATVRRERGRATAADLEAALAPTGYEADLASLEILPPGSDRSRIERLLRR